MRATHSAHSRPTATQRAQVFLARTKPLSSPRRRGTHNHGGSDYHWPCHMVLLRHTGPRLRGDDNGESSLHILASGNPGLLAPIAQFVALGPAFVGTNGGNASFRHHASSVLARSSAGQAVPDLS